MPIQHVRTAGELKQFLADVPDETLLTRETTGYYQCLRANGMTFIYVSKYQPSGGHASDDPKEAIEMESRHELAGKKLLLVGL